MSTPVTLKSLLKTTQSNLNALASKVEASLVAHDYDIHYVNARFGVPGDKLEAEGSHAISHVLVAVYILRGGRYIDQAAVRTLLKNATGCDKVTAIEVTSEKDPKGELFVFDCEVTEGKSEHWYVFPSVTTLW